MERVQDNGARNQSTLYRPLHFIISITAEIPCIMQQEKHISRVRTHCILHTLPHNGWQQKTKVTHTHEALAWSTKTGAGILYSAPHLCNHFPATKHRKLLLGTFYFPPPRASAPSPETAVAGMEDRRGSQRTAHLKRRAMAAPFTHPTHPPGRQL